MKQAIYVGVDVSKKQLDVAIRPLGKVFGVGHDRKAISQLVKWLKKLQPVCIAIDATGGLEKELAYALAAENLPVAAVNLRQVSNFAKSTGQRAKTDAIDAAVLAHFAEVMKPEVRPLPRSKFSYLASGWQRNQIDIAWLGALNRIEHRGDIS